MPDRNTWATPWNVYEKICQRWQVKPSIDLAADVENSKCEHHITEFMNSLKVDWMEFANCYHVPYTGWMNPPYSQPLMTEFIEKALAESKRGFTTVFLLPSWVDQNWYHDLILGQPNVEHEIWRGRIRHIPPAGVKPSSPRYGSIHGVIRGQW